MRKFLTSVVLIGFIALGVQHKASYAGEIDILLQKLVEKGVLTAGEAQQIGTETKEKVKAEIAEGKYSSLPAWVQSMKLKGDFRVRYQLDHAKTSDTGVTSDRNRGRVRLRLGIDAKVNDKITVGAGIATGTTDVTSLDAARSNNQSFANGFAKKPLVLDYAYASYTPYSWATVLGGKLKYQPWKPTDVFMDYDITPEGGVLQLKKKIGIADMWLDTMGFVLSETEPTTHNAMLFGVQGGSNFTFTDNVSLKAAVAYWDFSNVKGRAIDGSTGTNTKSIGSGATGLNMYGFRDITPMLELTVKNPLKSIADLTGLSMLDVEKIGLLGEYYNNLAAPDKNAGFATGFSIGNLAIDDWGKWQFQYVYSMTGKDSIPDTIVDSDRYGGKTGIRGHKASFQWGLGKNTWLQFAVFRFENITITTPATRRAPTTVVQADWNMKF